MSTFYAISLRRRLLEFFFPRLRRAREEALKAEIRRLCTDGIAERVYFFRRQ